MLFISISLNFINSSKSSFSKFFDWFIEFVKSYLIQNFGKIFYPDLYNVLIAV